MGSDDLLRAIKDAQNRAIGSEYGGKMSNQFINELKGSTLFQIDWSDLLSTAPTALSLMGACWIAASQPRADEIALEKAMPTDGFKHLTQKRSPTLRSCLVDLCNVGGRAAFVTAGANMDALQIRSMRICSERIELITKRLLPCNRDMDAFEDFNDALRDFSQEVKQCATLATETREAFSKWGRMAGELHAVTERQQGVASSLSVEEMTTKSEQTFAAMTLNDVKERATAAVQNLAGAEKRLDTALQSVPSQWESSVVGTLAGFNQDISSSVCTVLPALLAGHNNGTITGQGAVPSAIRNLSDPAYAAAATMQELANHFYEYLGGEQGNVDWTKFEDGNETAGLNYIAAALTNTKNNTSRGVASEPNRKFQDALDKLIAVTTNIRDFKKGQADISSKPLPEGELQQWRDGVKTGRASILALTSTASSFGSNNVPNAFLKVVPGSQAPNAASANAAANTALQMIQMANTALDNAQSNYEAAMARQSKTTAAMAAVEAKLATLQAEGKTLDSISSILQDSISVLGDMTIQIGKIEKFFAVLTTVIDQAILLQADKLSPEKREAGQRPLANGAIKSDAITKQTIYTLTLQCKGYVSLLGDICSMYTHIDRQYLNPGVELCVKLSKNDPYGDRERYQQELSSFTAESAKRVATVVKEKQDTTLNELKARAKRGAETTIQIENLAKERGLPLDNSAKSAIAAGGEAAKEAAREIIAAKITITGE